MTGSGSLILQITLKPAVPDILQPATTQPTRRPRAHVTVWLVSNATGSWLWCDHHDSNDTLATLHSFTHSLINQPISGSSATVNCLTRNHWHPGQCNLVLSDLLAWSSRTSVFSVKFFSWLYFFNLDVCHVIQLSQGMVDGSASKPALRQDTGYMVEKTYHDIAQ